MTEQRADCGGSGERTPEARDRKNDNFPSWVPNPIERFMGWFANGDRIWLLVISIIVFSAIIAQQNKNNTTARQAKASCERSRVFSPRLSYVYGLSILPDPKNRFAPPTPILNTKQLAKYKEGIPKSC